jgi:hypothetical protein
MTSIEFSEDSLSIFNATEAGLLEAVFFAKYKLHQTLRLP